MKKHRFWIGVTLVVVFFFNLMWLTDFDWVGLISAVLLTSILCLGVYLIVDSYEPEKE